MSAPCFSKRRRRMPKASAETQVNLAREPRKGISPDLRLDASLLSLIEQPVLERIPIAVLFRNAEPKWVHVEV
jgi:hypothetical protein